MPRLKPILVLILLLLPLLSGAQKQWTMQECIDYALAHNIRSRQAGLSTALAQSRLRQSNAALFPTLNGIADHNYSFGRTVDVFTNEFIASQTQTNSFSLRSNVTLFSGFQLVNTRRQYSLELQANVADEEKMRNDVALEIVTLYMQVLFNRENLGIATSAREAVSKQLIRTSRLVEAGSLPEGSRLDMESQLASEELRVISAENLLNLSLLDLAQSMELDSTKGFAIESPDLSKFQYTIFELLPGDIYQIAITNQPDVRASDLKVKAADAGLTVARGARSPHLSLGAAVGTGYSDARREVTGVLPPDSMLFGFFRGSPLYITPPEGQPVFRRTPFSSQLDENLNQFVGISLNVPIFNGWQARSAVERAKINLQSQQLERELVHNRLYKAIQQAHADANAALRRFNASAKNVRALSESFRYTEQKYTLGVLNSLDFIAAQNSLQRAESELLQARYEYVFKTKILDFYLGRQLTF